MLAEVAPAAPTSASIETTAAAFDPLMKAAPQDGVTVQKNLSYGEDARQVLDVFAKPGISNAPVVIFIHGGAYVRGDRDVYGGAYYGNIAAWFARQGMVGVNATYRLAPQRRNGRQARRTSPTWSNGLS